MPYDRKSDLPDGVRNNLPATPRKYIAKRSIRLGRSTATLKTAVATLIVKKPPIASRGRR